jgi:hypothetical protein
LYNLGKAAHYGEKMLETLGDFRSCVLVGVTDLEKVQFFKVIREQKGQFRYAIHHELTNVREVLCALLKSSPCDLFLELPVLEMSGVQYETVDYLGCGATSNVVLVKDVGGRSYAAKIPHSTKSLQTDHSVLSKLQGVNGVPQMFGWFDDGKSLKISPVGRKLNCKSISSWSDMVPGLVDVLREAHDLAIINRDVRPENIMSAEGRLYILDWGYAVAKGEPYAFSGGVMYASDRILGLLESGSYKVLAEEKDDLEALVHSIFALRYKSYFNELHGIDRMRFGDLRAFWEKCFARIQYWRPILEAARNTDYIKVKSEFERMVREGTLCK